MNSIKTNKVNCEICFHSDEYVICHKCFQTYIDKTIQFKKSLYIEKYNLKSSIQDIISKYNQKINSYNKKSQRRLKLERIQKMIDNRDMNLKIKQNMIIVMSEKLKKKRENIRLLKEMIDTEKRNMESNKYKHRKDEELIKELEKNSEIAKQYYFNFLTILLFGQPTNFNSFFSKIIQIEEYFEIQEYVKPNLTAKGNININNNLNIVTNKKNSIFNNNDLNEFNKLPNILSISQSGLFFNLNLQKDFDINFDKFIKLKPDILKNKNNIYQLNHYIYSLISFVKTLSFFLNVNLPYILDHNCGEYLITSMYNGRKYSLYFNPSPEIQNENYINEIIQGYTYLDVDLQILISYMKTGFKSKHSKKYKNCVLYSTQHSLFSHDLKDFLNIKKLLPNYKNFAVQIDKNQIIEDKVNKEFSIGSIEIEIKSDQIGKEDDGFVIIDNYYI